MICEEATQQIPETKQEKGPTLESAIGFTMDIEREEDPTNDRVKVTRSSELLPYRKWQR
jgi:cyanate lyase